MNFSSFHFGDEEEDGIGPDINGSNPHHFYL
jgi:hypothetical protein